MGPKSTSGTGTPSGTGVNLELNTKSYSNICKRLSAHLLSQHGVELTHTQARTAMAEALGFDSPNALDAELRHSAQKADSSPADSDPGQDVREIWEQQLRLTASAADDGARQKHRLKLREILSSRLGDLAAVDPLELAVQLNNLVLSLIAQRFPAKLSAADKRKVYENYPSATESLISERAMALGGVQTVLELAAQSMKIAIDYFPGSNSTADVKNDERRGPSVGPSLNASVDKAFQAAVQEGLSPFGAATIVILSGCSYGLRSGVAGTALVRTLVDSMRFVMGRDAPTLTPENEEAILKRVMAQMGISRAEAKRYLAFAKEQMGD